jgi:hypothetical protein
MKDGHAKCATLVHLILLRKQRLIKHCVLSRIAWTQNGDEMCANPGHLEHLRMQRLMKNSAMSRAPFAQRTQMEEGYIFVSLTNQRTYFLYTTLGGKMLAATDFNFSNNKKISA